MGAHTELRVWELDFCVCSECNRKPEPRKFSWPMHVRPLTLVAAIINEGDSLPVAATTFDSMGIEFIREQPAAYDDNRTFVVLEKTRGLEWAIVDTRDGGTMKAKLGFDDAVEWCKLLNDSEDMNDRSS